MEEYKIDLPKLVLIEKKIIFLGWKRYNEGSTGRGFITRRDVSMFYKHPQTVKNTIQRLCELGFFRPVMGGTAFEYIDSERNSMIIGKIRVFVDKGYEEKLLNFQGRKSDD